MKKRTYWIIGTIILIFFLLFGGLSMSGYNNCGSSGDGNSSSGEWGWPFEGVQDPPDYLDGGQFGNSAGSYTARKQYFHDGFDWSFGLNGVHAGSKVLAIHDGTVKTVAYAAGLDWYVWVEGSDGYNVVYQETFNQSDIKVKEGDTVKVGDEIGTAQLNQHMHLGVTKEKDFNKAEASWATDDGTWLDPVKLISDGIKSGGSSSDSDAASNSSNAVGGDWKQKNSHKWKNAKAIFDTLTKKMGFSGAGAAGAVGNAIAESGLDEKIVNSYGYTGFFQWDNKQRLYGGGYIKQGDSSTLTTENEIKLMQYELNGNWKKTKSSVGHAKTPHDGAWNWFIDFEGMSQNTNQYGTQRDPGAEWAYKEFGGENISADDSLLGQSAEGADVGAASESSDGGACGGSGSDVDNYTASSFNDPEDQELYNKVKDEDDPATQGTTKHTGEMLKFLKAKFKIPVAGGYRPGDDDGTGHGHGAGMSVDYMVYDDKEKGDKLAKYATKNYKELGVYYVIWQQKFWMPEPNIYGPASTWNPMLDRGSPTQNHMDHVHISYVN